MGPSLMAHGGAWQWDDSLDLGKRKSVSAAAEVGHTILRDGGSALDAVEQTVIALENDPLLDAGTGGHLNQDGVVELDALIVDGATLDFGAVAGVSRVRNPVVLARRIMHDTPQCFFVGNGADRMARSLGLDLIDNEDLVTPTRREVYESKQTVGACDTVGAVAIDHDGNTAAATSTSGTSFKPAGRVGDSPLYGCGGYAENGVGSVGATGLGENIMRAMLSRYTCDQMAAGLSAGEAVEVAMNYVKNRFQNSMSGLIAIDRDGNLGAAHTTPKLVFAWVDRAGNVQSATNASALGR